jgi:YVTN family beta-propeller protein
MINKQKLYSIGLVSAAMILMLISIAGAAPFAYISNSDSNNVSVIDTATNKVTATVNAGDHP